MKISEIIDRRFKDFKLKIKKKYRFKLTLHNLATKMIFKKITKCLRNFAFLKYNMTWMPIYTYQILDI